jgi:type II secretory pathway pseudopilin PulG
MSRKALSVTVTTVILALAILILSSASAYLATNIFEIQNQQTEFNQAKEVAVYLAQAIEDVAFKEGTSSYVRFNIRTSKPNYINQWAKITLTIKKDSEAWTPIDNKTGTIIVQGGSYASTSFEPLRGLTKITDNWRRESVIVTESTTPLVWVYTNQSNGAKIYLDPARVRVTYLGLLNYSWGILNGKPQFQLTNIVEVKLITLKFGGAVSGTVLNVKTLCRNINIKQVSFQSGQLKVEATLQLDSSQITQEVTLDKLDTRYPTVVTVIVSEVEIYMLGG